MEFIYITKRYLDFFLVHLKKKSSKPSHLHSYTTRRFYSRGSRSAVGSASTLRVRGPISIPGPVTYIVSSSADTKRVVVSYWRKYVHEVLVNRLGGLFLPGVSVVIPT